MVFIRQYGIPLYFIVLFAQCLSICLEWETVRIATKIVLVPVLLLHLLVTGGSRLPATVYIGLLFGYLGDLALLQNYTLYFLIGMGCFILSHIFYSLYFLSLQDKGQSRLREAFAAAVVVMIISAAMFAILNPYLGSLRVPVLVYMVVISVMSILSANTAANQAVRRVALWCFIPGAAFFVMSDAALALNKFVFQVWWLNVVVMFTYGMAQFYLSRGFLRAGRLFLRAS